jgi:hypothetical protein
VDTIKHVVNDELLSNNAYTIALKVHFATFDYAKFALIPAAWKQSLESKLEQTNAILNIATEQLANKEQHSQSKPTHHTDSLHDLSTPKNGLKPMTAASRPYKQKYNHKKSQSAESQAASNWRWKK